MAFTKKEHAAWVADHSWSKALSTRARTVCMANNFNTPNDLKASVLRGDFLPLYYCKFRDCGEKTACEIYAFCGLEVPL